MDETPAEPQPEQAPLPELPPWDDSLHDALAMIETWAAVDAAEPGSEAEKLAEAAMALLLKHVGNAYAVALTTAKVLSRVRETWFECEHECCQAAAPARFRAWFTEQARSG